MGRVYHINEKLIGSTIILFNEYAKVFFLREWYVQYFLCILLFITLKNKNYQKLYVYL